MLAFFVHLTGFWTLFESYVLDFSNLYRNWSYVLFGTVLMVGSGTIQLHAGVYREAAVAAVAIGEEEEEEEGGEADDGGAQVEEEGSARSASLGGRDALPGVVSPRRLVGSGEV